MRGPDDATGGTHRIRLRGPWEAVASGDADQAPVRFHFPGAWRELMGLGSTQVVVRRRFARPANLEAPERVWLVCDDFAPAAEARLNGAELGASGRWDVTARLESRNLLEIELTAGAPQDAILTGEVRLEIRSD